MSTSETVHFDVCPCPCGIGHVVKSVTTQDNPWSGADISYSLNCADCRSKWIIEHRRLVSSAEWQAERSTWNEEYKIGNEIDQFLAPLIDNHFASLKLVAKTHELRELQRIGIGNHDIRNYRAGRNSGKPISAMCYPRRNLESLRRLVSSAGLLNQFRELEAKFENAKIAHQLAQKQVRYIPIIERTSQ
jgi:hypothetical protein